MHIGLVIEFETHNTHLSIYKNSCRSPQSCALYGNFPCRMVPLFNLSFQNCYKRHINNEQLANERLSVCADCVKREPCVNNTVDASVSYRFIAGDKTGSKLFLLVQQQQQQQLQRSCGRKKRCFLLSAWSAQQQEGAACAQRCV